MKVFVWGEGKEHRYLNVKRYVANSQSLIKDRDNLIGGLKPIKDVLTRMKIFVDDCDKWLTFDIVQGVDASNLRIEIEVSDMQL